MILVILKCNKLCLDNNKIMNYIVLCIIQTMYFTYYTLDGFCVCAKPSINPNNMFLKHLVVQRFIPIVHNNYVRKLDWPIVYVTEDVDQW